MNEIRKPAAPHRVVLGHSGGLDTAAAIRWLADSCGAEVIAVTIDLGQKKEWLEEVRDRALATGAVRAHVVDMRDEFARDYLARGLKAGLLCPDPASMAARLAGPLVAQTLVSIAAIEQARTVAHGDPGAAPPLAAMVAAIDPALTIVAVPASMTEHRDREEPAAPRHGAALPTEPAFVDIALERGVPTAVNGVAMPWLDLVGSLDIIARTHGVGPSPLVLLHVAHDALQTATVSNDARRFAAQVGAEYRRMLLDGSWFSPMRQALDAYVDRLQERVGGIVRLQLFNGVCTVVDVDGSVAAAPTIIPLTRA
jgi:argininosuccinate synthase